MYTELLQQIADRCAALSDATIAAADGPNAELAERLAVLSGEAGRINESIQFAALVLDGEGTDEITTLQLMLGLSLESLEELLEYC